jgi:hypothetical protein
VIGGGGGVEHRLRHREAQGSEAREVVGSSGRPVICERRRNRLVWSGFCRHNKPQTTREWAIQTFMQTWRPVIESFSESLKCASPVSNCPRVSQGSAELMTMPFN